MDKHPWEVAREQTLRRYYFASRRFEELERDVNFFVLALEQLGARTLSSCAGHPFGFYIYFNASYRLAKQIRRCGYFNVELAGMVGQFSISLMSNENSYLHREHDDPWNEDIKIYCLKNAADAWIKQMLSKRSTPTEDMKSMYAMMNENETE